MKTKISQFPAFSLAIAATFAILNAQLSIVYAQGTAFTYQGKLVSGANAASGIYDFTFSLWTANTTGIQLGGTFTTNAVAVTNGYFVATLDFSNRFNGDSRWLEIAVRTNGGPSFATLAPRQLLTPTPYAIYSTTASNAITANTAGSSSIASIANAVANNAVTATSIASGQVVKSLNSLKDDVSLAAGANVTLTPSGQTLTLASPADWHQGGNAGTTAGTDYIGTADNQPLELKAYGKRALRLEPASGASTEVNVIAGSSANSVAATTVGATVGGGSNNVIGVGSSRSVVAGGFKNLIESASVSAIGGGSNNKISTNSYASVVAGGENNQIQGGPAGSDHSVISGGYGNILEPSLLESVIGGGIYNLIQNGAWRAVIGGGYINRIGTNASGSAILGGFNNTIERNSYGSAIGGGEANLINSNANHSVIGGGWNNQIYPFAGASLPGGGSGSTISGGVSNVVSGWQYYSAGLEEPITNAPATNATIAGGVGNWIGTGNASSINGGAFNQIGGDYGTVGGGLQNTLTEDYYGNQTIGNTIGGGIQNLTYGNYGTVGGGILNEASWSGTVGGGTSNTTAMANATVAGGLANKAGGLNSSVGGGAHNEAIGNSATVSGGTMNKANADFTTIQGGKGAIAEDYGQQAYASGSFSAQGDAQSSVYVLRGTGTNNNLTELFLDGASERITLHNYREAMTVDILLTGYSTNNEAVSWRMQALFKHGPAGLQMVGTPAYTLVGSDLVTTAVSVAVWSSNWSYLQITAFPGPSYVGVFRWIAVVRTAEVSFK